ncbi:hypothetical protein Nepgr_022439 [Nepenthes gracilis]|uniref:ENT domain-containing protein n=1 Tax=Nepenthes gracilis TaxID=150966 RepID=A0AAD3SYU2_NEPGR|nr:hypothetical protein Nepgr_022439 [Nepenthes gracilis]
MGYEPYDSSGTDDDLPQSHHTRMPRVGHTAVNGRSNFAGSIPYTGIHAENDVDAQIHHLEREGYSAVLRAFKAQADAITWEKESLITELRKELRISNEEHRELLGKVNAEDVIRRIREWRQASGVQSGMIGTNQSVHDPVSSPTVSASGKKPKLNPPVPSQSFGGPPPSFHPQSLTAASQPSSSAAKRDSAMGSKGKKYKTDQVIHRSGARVGDNADAVMCDRLIGRKVRTRWPEDNSFYEAVITDYKPVEGLHALVYDLGTTKETWEWVDLSEISPEDIQWEGEDPGISLRGANRCVSRDNAPGKGRGRGAPKGHAKKNFPPSQNGIGKKASDVIQILRTDTLIKEVERIFGAGHASPREVERAKKVLMEHEQALVDAIARIEDISDGESDARLSRLV